MRVSRTPGPLGALGQSAAGKRRGNFHSRGGASIMADQQNTGFGFRIRPLPPVGAGPENRETQRPAAEEKETAAPADRVEPSSEPAGKGHPLRPHRWPIPRLGRGTFVHRRRGRRRDRIRSQSPPGSQRLVVGGNSGVLGKKYPPWRQRRGDVLCRGRPRLGRDPGRRVVPEHAGETEKGQNRRPDAFFIQRRGIPGPGRLARSRTRRSGDGRSHTPGPARKSQGSGCPDARGPGFGNCQARLAAGVFRANPTGPTLSPFGGPVSSASLVRIAWKQNRTPRAFIRAITRLPYTAVARAVDAAGLEKTDATPCWRMSALLSPSPRPWRRLWCPKAKSGFWAGRKSAIGA